MDELDPAPEEGTDEGDLPYRLHGDDMCAEGRDDNMARIDRDTNEGRGDTYEPKHAAPAIRVRRDEARLFGRAPLRGASDPNKTGDR